MAPKCGKRVAADEEQVPHDCQAAENEI